MRARTLVSRGGVRDVGAVRSLPTLMVSLALTLVLGCGNERRAADRAAAARATTAAPVAALPAPALRPSGAGATTEPSAPTATAPTPGPGATTPEPAVERVLTRVVWGGLDVTLVGEGRVAVVLLHGYGGSGDDMLPVAEALVGALPVRVAVPTSPRAWIHGGGGRAWFERTADDADAQLELAAREAAGVGRALVLDGREPGDVVLAGFSQGASLALEAALRAADPPRALVLFSGRLLPSFEGHWSALEGVPVFVSHGRSDTLIPFEDGERTAERARAAGADVTFAPFEGGHTLPADVIARAVAFLRPLLEPSE